MPRRSKSSFDFGQRRRSTSLGQSPRASINQLPRRSSTYSLRSVKHNSSGSEMGSPSHGPRMSAKWTPGQEFSHMGAYDPIEDMILAHRYAANRKDLRFYHVFRFARCIDWLLMSIGILFALLGSIITPWLYYWGGVTIHDILIFERCNATILPNGQCSIPNYCDSRLTTVGTSLFLNILYGWIAYNVLQMGYTLCFTLAADRQTKAMRVAYFESVVRKDMAWFDIYSDKDFAKEMNEEITQIRLGIGDVIPNFVNLACTVMAILVIVLLLNYYVALGFLCFVPGSMLVVYLGNWAERKRSAISDKLFSKASLIAKESLVNIKVIKMYEGEAQQAKRFGEALDYLTEDGVRKRREEVKWMLVAAASSGGIWLLLNCATALVFWLGQGTFEDAGLFCKKQTIGLISLAGYGAVFEEGGWNLEDSPGEILIVYFGLMYLTLHATELPNFISLMQIAKLNATSVFFIIDWKSRIDNMSNEGKIPKRSAVGRLDFYNVTFRYPQKPDITVLHIKQLTIFSGQFVAFAGPADSGKNTILKLIPRLYDTCSGYIALDAVNLQNYNIHWLRRQMCVISEAPVIFTGTISDNILFGKLNASEEEMVKACEMASIHHVISNLPNGYKTIITSKEFGDTLNRLEKRQICLARAYLHRSRLILLDNPVQPEDDPLEPLLLTFINHFRDTATVILASTMVTALSKRADRIYYMENGRIVESGNHIQLIQAKGRYYTRLEDTINTSTESRNKFESQLKAYKYSQMLQRKKSSSLHGSLNEPLEEEAAGGGGEEEVKKKGWLDMFKKNKKSRGKGDEAGMGWKEVMDGAKGEEGKRKSILRRASGLNGLEEVGRLEEAYNRNMYANRQRRRSSGDNSGYMHHGFGMMGFQRMNFARPMTNYSTQIQKQRYAFESTELTSGNQQLNALRRRKLSLHPDTVQGFNASTETMLTPNDSSSHVHFNKANNSVPPKKSGFFNFKGKAAAISKSKSHLLKSKWSKSKSKVTLALHATKRNSGPTGKRGSGSPKSSMFQALAPSKTAHSSKKPVSRARAPAIANIPPIKSKSVLNQTDRKRSSVQAILEALTDPNAKKIGGHVELDNVSIATQEMDSFLAEYDEGVYATLHNNVMGFWRDIFYVTKHDWLYIIPGILASIILGCSITYQTWIVGTFFETLGDDEYIESSLKIEVTWLITFMVATGVVTGIAAFVQEFFFAMAGRRMTRKLRERLFAHILHQDLAWFDEKDHDIGILTLQLYADTTIVHHILLMTYGIVIQITFNMITSITFAAVETVPDSLIITICFISGMPILVAIVFLSSKKELHEASHFEEKFRMAGTFAQEFLVNIKTWFSLGAEGFFISRYSMLLDKEYRFVKISSILITCIHSAVQTSSWLLYGIFIYVALQTHELEGHNHHHHHNHHEDYHAVSIKQYTHPTPINLPTLIGYIMIATELLIFGAFRIGDQISILTDVEFGKTAAHKIMRILVNNSPTERMAGESKDCARVSNKFNELDSRAPPPEIGLTGVTYFYPSVDQALQYGHLHNVSMIIAPYSYVAIVGPPGSGKSTLCNIMLRMCNPTLGVYDFNGDDCAKFSPSVSRRLMGFVEYDPCLFDYSIEDNIRFGKGGCPEDTPKAEVEQATKLTACHYDILDLTNDYRTLVGGMERDAQNFSLKQRIAYARAMIRKPKILIVDDATTSVDTHSDHKLLQVLNNVRDDRTLIVFSHKIEPIRDADTIYVLWEGELVETGSDTNLLKRQGYYYEMFMTQKVLQESMRNSPQQLSTIRYNIKKDMEPYGIEEMTREKLAEIARKNKRPTRASSLAFVKFLDEKVGRMKREKEQRRHQLEDELPQLAEEEKQRGEKRKSSRLSEK